MDIFQKAKANYDGGIHGVLTLDHNQREKGRLKIKSDRGHEVRVFMERGQLLKCGDILQSHCNHYFQIALAEEPLVVATAADWSVFSRVCYHLGNRHTRIQIGECCVRFLDDPVLVELVEHFGMHVERKMLPFEPELGVYGHSHAGKSRHHEHTH